MAVPVEINHVKAQGIVRITWDDGHSGEYPKEHLRGYCPCALCQGHEAAIEKRFVEVPNLGLDTIEPVGNYAEGSVSVGATGTTPSVSVGATGIYTFDYLRSLCPCQECEKS